MLASINPAPMGMALALWIIAAIIPLLVAVSHRAKHVSRSKLSLIVMSFLVGVLAAALWDFYTVWEFHHAAMMPASVDVTYSDLPVIWQSNLLDAMKIGLVSAGFAFLLWFFLPGEQPVQEVVKS